MRKRHMLVAMGPGETSQARALADYLYAKGQEVFFVLQQEVNCRFVQEDKQRFNIFIAEEPAALHQLLAENKPDTLLLFNSKMWHKDTEFQKHEPPEKPLTICVDSNWLFNKDTYPFFPFVQWADKYLVNIPQTIFEQGLEENGGGFTLEPEMKNKIKPVGFIPSYQPRTNQQISDTRKYYQIGDNEKLVFAYISGFGADNRAWALEKLTQAVERLTNQGQTIKVLYVGSLEHIKINSNWLINEPQLGAADFYAALAASDLVFQHQGLSTLAQAISAQVPVIANVAIPAHEKLPKIHYWEVEPFARSGICHLAVNTTPIEDITKSIETLLFDEKKTKAMREKQAQQYTCGEAVTAKIIQDLLMEIP